MCLPSFLVTHIFQLHILCKERSQIVQWQEADWKARASANLSNQLVTLTENTERYKHMQTLRLNKALENTQRSFQKINSIIGLWHVNAAGTSVVTEVSLLITLALEWSLESNICWNKIPFWGFLEDSECPDCRRTKLKTSRVKLTGIFKLLGFLLFLSIDFSPNL